MSNVKATAGLRGASWNEAALPPATALSAHTLRTADGAATTGLLFRTGGERTVVCMMHPREMLATHYLIPSLLRAGVAVWNQGPRSVGNDLRLEHEIALFDVAAAMTHLRAAGFEKIVLLGMSGGATLYAFYQQQAARPGAQRIDRTPGGRPTGLATLDMPRADAFVFVSPHPGQGLLLMNALDPSVTDEADALSTDPALDPFSPANGFRRPPEGARYAPDFIARYRAAQRARVARIDTAARQMIGQRQQARARLKETPSRNDRLIAAHTPIFNVWRTDADLRSWDLTLDPSDRSLGSLWGSDPAASNLGSVGFGRVCTPESWLSTWSGLSSNAAFVPCAGAIDQPVLLVEFSGDNAVFPADLDTLFDAIGSPAKQRVRVRGNHQGLALAETERNGQDVAGEHIADWLATHR